MKNNIETLRCVALPKGYASKVCPFCKGNHLVGALLTKDATEEDPNVVCKDCGNIIE